MSTDSTAATHNARTAVLILVGLAAVIVTGLLLREHGPGNMGLGLLAGGAVGLAAVGVGYWRVSRRPDRVTTFERAWTQTGDERDHAVLNRSFAVLGLASFPLTSIAAIAVGFGAPVEMALALLLFAEIAVGAVAFGAISRRN